MILNCGINSNWQATRLLPAKSLSSKAVVKICGLSLEGFLREHFIPSSPIIISGSMNHWPATDRWSDMNYIKCVAGFRTVPVEVSPILCLVAYVYYTQCLMHIYNLLYVVMTNVYCLSTS